MHIKIDVDIPPAEFRELMGWPDVTELQREGMAKIVEQMRKGADGYDPLSLMRPFLEGSLSSMEKLQKMMAGAMSGFTTDGPSSKKAGAESK